MKTKQEQIEKLAQLIGRIKGDCENCDCNSCEVNGEDCCCVHYICATFLVDAGYGNVSEYKAEIERLRTTLGQCNTELNSALESLKSQCREIGALKAGTKQAKIDVLNKLKEEMGDVKVGMWTASQIDELIKEVENEQKD